mgnify:CR=1 FL=1|jgi:hypothetical protein|tara:strand:- start:900 stop:1157 length:258 start_codon:yes stop_codon:yes gene_type:complete
MKIISKTDEKRWFCIKTSEDIIQVFGHVDLGNVLESGQPILLTYLTEDELEIYVNSELGANYYKDAVESDNDIFMGTSGKYTIAE